MPKGSTVARKLRNELRELRELKAQITESSPPAVQRRVPWDWTCGKCSFYCYNDKDRCPRCSASKGVGQLKPGFRRRIRVQDGPPASGLPMARSAGNVVPPTRRVQQPTLQTAAVRQPQQSVQKSYVDAVKSQKPVQTQVRGSQAQVQQQSISHPEPPPQQPQPNVVRSPTQYGQVALVGLLSPAVPQSTQVQPPLIANIFSADEEAGLEQDEAWADETIQELDLEEKDPHKVWLRMGKVSRAIEKRKRRLEKAWSGVESQKAVLEEAKAELAARTQSAEEIAADIRQLNEVQQDLAAKHGQLLAEIGRQQQGPPPSVEEGAEKAQRLLWDVAANLRLLGDNPKLSQAISLLGDLYVQASQVAAGDNGSQTVVSLAPGSVEQAAPSSFVQPPAVPPAVNVPQLPPVCTKCWSFACCCSSVPVDPGAAVPACVAIEVDQERGQKRSCRDASLPDRAEGAPQGPEAILVDSAGNAATVSGAAEETGQGVDSSSVQVSEQSPLKKQPPVSPLASAGAVASGIEATDSGAVQPAQQDQDGQSRGEDEEDKAESRKSFAALVRATCSSRSYPY